MNVMCDDPGPSSSRTASEEGAPLLGQAIAMGSRCVTEWGMTEGTHALLGKMQQQRSSAPQSSASAGATLGSFVVALSYMLLELLVFKTLDVRGAMSPMCIAGEAGGKAMSPVHTYRRCSA